MNNKPTRSGFYWYKFNPRCAQVVEVDMTYLVRGKVVPMVLSHGWKRPLDLISEDFVQWSTRLKCPIKEEYP
jgi:hypothetical protein